MRLYINISILFLSHIDHIKVQISSVIFFVLFLSQLKCALNMKIIWIKKVLILLYFGANVAY